MSYVSRMFSLARNRQGIRAFSDRPVPPELLERILDCARFTPSAKEAQPWRFVVVQSAQTRVQISAECFNAPLVRSAPCLILCCAQVHSHISGNGRSSFQGDVSAATQSMVMAAADMGLATTWITGFRESQLRSLMGIPSDIPIVAILAVGYPEGFFPLSERRRLSEVVGWESWLGKADR